MKWPRPLDPVRTIKRKLVILLVAAGGAAASVFWIKLGWLPLQTSIAAVVVGLLTAHILAHGMTAPLREMTAAARAMAHGDYSQRVRVTSRDEVGELARAFTVMAADLEAADRERRELIANVSHELRTPISSLQALLENVVDGVAEPDPDTMRTALAQTERLARLVTELLDLSRIDAGVLPLRVEPVTVEPLLAAAVSEAAVAGRPVAFSLDVQPASLSIVADGSRLHQVVANLLDNASRHSPPDGTVTVRARRACADGGLILDVADEGPGIPPAERQRVFERFTRGGSRARSQDGGTGLGLAIARWAVDLHGGTIAVADSGSGCVIRMVLPARS